MVVLREVQVSRLLTQLNVPICLCSSGIIGSTKGQKADAHALALAFYAYKLSYPSSIYLTILV